MRAGLVASLILSSKYLVTRSVGVPETPLNLSSNTAATSKAVPDQEINSITATCGGHIAKEDHTYSPPIKDAIFQKARAKKALNSGPNPAPHTQ